MKEKTHELLEAYYYGKMTELELIHKIQMLAEYHSPSDWSYEDYKQGREQNKLL